MGASLAAHKRLWVLSGMPVSILVGWVPALTAEQGHRIAISCTFSPPTACPFTENNLSTFFSKKGEARESYSKES